MAIAQKNDKVKVHYTGRLTNGEQFDSSQGREPLEFTVGAGQMILGFDNAVEGMEVNEKKTVLLAPEEAYGPLYEELVTTFDKSKLPADLNPEVGQTLVASSPEGHQQEVQVTAVTETSVTVDGNHPLAGKELEFDIELVEIG